MILTIERKKLGEATLGELSVEGQFECFTLEDKVREELGVNVADWKVKGSTAIPIGTYRVVLAWSNRWARILPKLCLVPGFEGILIHPGNTIGDTEGCILVGDQVAGTALGLSRKAHERLYRKIEAHNAVGADIFITVKNPARVTLAA